MSVDLKTIMTAIVTVVVITLIILVFVQMIPASTKPEIVTNYVMEFSKAELPCLINCYSSITGDADRLLRETSYLQKGKSDKLVEYFQCNQEILTVATMLFELARWDSLNVNVGTPVPHTLTGDETYSGRAFDFLYNCLANGDCDNNRDKTLRNFCAVDDYLTYYGYLDCIGDYTLMDLINPRRLKYSAREGRDINNDFVCDKTTESSNINYDLCVMESVSKFTQNCQPSWLTLTNQQLTEENKASDTAVYSKGRCEDFALLYKTLFRAIDVPEEDLTLTTGFCELPPPCRKLVDSGRLELISLDECVSPANLSIKNVGVIEGCSSFVKEVPLSYYSRFIIGKETSEYKYTFTIKSNFDESVKSSYYRNLTLDGDLTNDLRWINYHSTNMNYDLIESNMLEQITGTQTAKTLYFTCLDVNNRCPGDKTKGINWINQSGKITLGMQIRITDENNCGSKDGYADVTVGFKGANADYNEIYSLPRGEKVSIKLTTQSTKLNNDINNKLETYISAFNVSSCEKIEYELSNLALISESPSDYPFAVESTYFTDDNMAAACEEFMISGKRINIESSSTSSCSLTQFIHGDC